MNGNSIVTASSAPPPTAGDLSELVKAVLRLGVRVHVAHP